MDCDYAMDFLPYSMRGLIRTKLRDGSKGVFNGRIDNIQWAYQRAYIWIISMGDLKGRGMGVSKGRFINLTENAIRLRTIDYISL